MDRRRYATAVVLVAAVLGAAALASTLGGHGTGTVWGGDLVGEDLLGDGGCQVADAGDCAVTGTVRTIDGDPAARDFGLSILYGTESALRGNIVLLPDGRVVATEDVDPGSYDRERVVLAENESAVSYATAPVPGGEAYVVAVAVNASGYGITWVEGSSGRFAERVSNGTVEYDTLDAAALTYRGDLPRADFDVAPLAAGGGLSTGEERVVTRRPVGYLLLAALVIGLLVAFVFAGSSSVETPDDSDGAEPDAAEIGEIAGDAADAIEQEAAHANAVYRAWAEMTAVLDVAEPATATPAEFADAAAAAGLAEDDVAELTDLFREVRYGGVDPGAHGDMALETLRRIEDAYGRGPDTGGTEESP